MTRDVGHIICDEKLMQEYRHLDARNETEMFGSSSEPRAYGR